MPLKPNVYGVLEAAPEQGARFRECPGVTVAISVIGQLPVTNRELAAVSADRFMRKLCCLW